MGAGPAEDADRALLAVLRPVVPADDARAVDLRPRRRPGHRGRLHAGPRRLGRAAAPRRADRRGLRHRLAHPRGPQLAGQPLRHARDGHPQGRADGPRPAPSLPHRRGAERRVERLRRVRRADRDRRALAGPARLLPHGGDHRADDVVAARRAHAGRGPGAGRRGAAAAAPPPPSSAGRALAHLRPHLAGHRHRGRAAHPARDRRRADLRRQLRPTVAVGQAGRSRCRDLAVGGRGRRRAAVGDLPRRPGLARHPRGRVGRAHRRRAHHLPRLRPVHGRPDPHLLRARPEEHPLAGERPQGGRDPRAAPAVA